jgi:alkanesulfonate monooxygenase SsuD/methylene tetrahydromethanopterin reductase-like flavin-dependent oxidoreductase (luciferase family)
MIGTMRIGIGLPAAVPGADMAQIGSFAAQAEQAGFESVGVIDRLVYDNLDPLIALAAAAACTSHIRLISTVVNVNWRANPRLLAKQISSVVRVSGGRFTARLAGAGCTDVLLYPCSADLDQIERLSQALSHAPVP